VFFRADAIAVTFISTLIYAVGGWNESRSDGWATPGNNFASLPETVRFEIGQALYQAELGERHPSACAMRGLNAVEIVSDYRGDTYRGVYTTRFKGFIYVLHCFQKNPKLESKRQSGIWS